MSVGYPSLNDPARVVICDDSAIVRAALSRILHEVPEIRVVARVSNGQTAIEAVRQRLGTSEAVDVMLLDLEMPVMDGLTALPILLRCDPSLRVLISSSITTPGAKAAMRALRLGAADYIAKPSTVAFSQSLPFEQEVIERIKGLFRLRRMTMASSQPKSSCSLDLRPPVQLTPSLLAIGSSTGGPQALFTLLAKMQDIQIPIVVAQHMPATFTPFLAEHIQRLGLIPCAEAIHGQTLQPGHVYIAPGGRHLLVTRSDTGELRAAISDAMPENHCRPSVDILLRSAAAACPGRTVVIMLTGMGRDGLEGTRAVVEGGGVAFAQDEASSVVWGMPGAIAKAGLCQAILPLDKLADAIKRVLAR